MGPRLRAGAVHGAVALWRERVDRFIDIVRAVENTPRGGEWTPHGMEQWTHRARGQRGIPGRYGARDLVGSGPPRRCACGSVPRACAGVTPRSGELRTCTGVDRSRGRVGTYSRTYAQCVALTGISHTRAGLRRKPGAGREGEAKAETSSTTAKGGTYDQGTRNFLAGRPPRKTPLVGGRTPVL